MPTFLKNIEDANEALGFRGRSLLKGNLKILNYLDLTVYFDERNCGKIIDKRKLNFNKSKLGI